MQLKVRRVYLIDCYDVFPSLKLELEISVNISRKIRFIRAASNDQIHAADH